MKNKLMWALAFTGLFACGTKNNGSTALTGGPKTPTTAAGGHTIVYKLGETERTLTPKRFSVTIKTESAHNAAGQLVYNSCLVFTIHDIEAGKSIRLYVKDEKQVENFNGNYPLRRARGFEQGESIRSATVTIIPTDDASMAMYNEDGGVLSLKMQGNSFSAVISKGQVKDREEKTVSFSLNINSTGVQVKRTP